MLSGVADSKSSAGIRSVSHWAGERPLLCSEGNRHQPALSISLDVGVGEILTARAPNRHRSSRAFTETRRRRAALATHTGEKMDTTTLLVIVLVVLLLGGGGFFYRRRT